MKRTKKIKVSLQPSTARFQPIVYFSVSTYWHSCAMRTFNWLLTQTFGEHTLQASGSQMGGEFPPRRNLAFPRGVLRPSLKIHFDTLVMHCKQVRCNLLLKVVWYIIFFRLYTSLQTFIASKQKYAGNWFHLLNCHVAINIAKLLAL